MSDSGTDFLLAPFFPFFILSFLLAVLLLGVLFVSFFKAPRSQRRLISSSNLTVSFLTAFFLGLFSSLSASGILMEFSPSFNFSSISVSNRCTSTSALELIFLSDLTSISLIKVLNFSRSFFSGEFGVNSSSSEDSSSSLESARTSFLTFVSSSSLESASTSFLAFFSVESFAWFFFDFGLAVSFLLVSFFEAGEDFSCLLFSLKAWKALSLAFALRFTAFAASLPESDSEESSSLALEGKIGNLSSSLGFFESSESLESLRSFESLGSLESSEL